MAHLLNTAIEQWGDSRDYQGLKCRDSNISFYNGSNNTPHQKVPNHHRTGTQKITKTLFYKRTNTVKI